MSEVLIWQLALIYVLLLFWGYERLLNAARKLNELAVATIKDQTEQFEQLKSVANTACDMVEQYQVLDEIAQPTPKKEHLN